MPTPFAPRGKKKDERERVYLGAPATPAKRQTTQKAFVFCLARHLHANNIGSASRVLS